MSENKQSIWLSKYFTDEYYKSDKWPKWYGVCDILINDSFPSRSVILADLAFRLRDEVNKITNWWDACQCVYEYVAKEEFDKDRGWKSETGIWFQDFAKPIHWIVAALIAPQSYVKK